MFPLFYTCLGKGVIKYLSYLHVIVKLALIVFGHELLLHFYHETPWFSRNYTVGQCLYLCAFMPYWCIVPKRLEISLNFFLVI